MLCSLARVAWPSVVRQPIIFGLKAEVGRRCCFSAIDDFDAYCSLTVECRYLPPADSSLTDNCVALQHNIARQQLPVNAQSQQVRVHYTPDNCGLLLTYMYICWFTTFTG